MQWTWQLWSLDVNTVAEGCVSMNSEMKELVFNLRFCLNFAVEIIVMATFPRSCSCCRKCSKDEGEGMQFFILTKATFDAYSSNIMNSKKKITSVQRLWVYPWNGWVASNLDAVSPLFVICCASCCCSAVWKSQSSSFIIIAAGWYFWSLNPYLN